MDESGTSNLPTGDINEIAKLLDILEQLAPTVDTGVPKGISYRTTEDTETLNDALDEPEETTDLQPDVQDWIAWQEQQELPFIQRVDLLQVGTPPVPVVAIDSGLARLGETEDGLIIALRGTIVTLVEDNTTLHLYRSGPIYLRNVDRLQLLHLIGQSLNRPDIFVELDDESQPARIKGGVADEAQKYGDRFRNWFERILQRFAVQAVSNGLLIIDGALTKNTRDTPTEFLDELVQLANTNGNTILGISKQSRLEVANRSVRFWLSEQPQTVAYRRLTNLMSSDMRERVVGGTYAVRFSPMGPTFRVDVKPVDGQTEDEAIAMLFSSCLIRGGYPDILARAHAHSYFTSPSVTTLQAQAGVSFNLRPEPEPMMVGIFGPFGGRFK